MVIENLRDADRRLLLLVSDRVSCVKGLQKLMCTEHCTLNATRAQAVPRVKDNETNNAKSDEELKKKREF
jgi:hypothetical protein